MEALQHFNDVSSFSVKFTVEIVNDTDALASDIVLQSVALLILSLLLVASRSLVLFDIDNLRVGLT